MSIKIYHNILYLFSKMRQGWCRRDSHLLAAFFRGEFLPVSRSRSRRLDPVIPDWVHSTIPAPASGVPLQGKMFFFSTDKTTIMFKKTKLGEFSEQGGNRMKTKLSEVYSQVQAGINLLGMEASDGRLRRITPG
jgi:hypothetical protein